MIAGHLEQHLPWGLGSSLPLVRMGLTEHGGFLGKPQQRGPCSRPEVQEKHRPVLWTNSGIPGSQNSRFLYVRCPDLWGTQTQCLSFPAREMGLRDKGVGWVGGVGMCFAGLSGWGSGITGPSKGWVLICQILFSFFVSRVEWGIGKLQAQKYTLSVLLSQGGV